MASDVTVTSLLTRSAPEVWARVTTVAGIRDELRPVLRMTTPPGLRGTTIDDLGDRLDQPLGRSWLLLLGVLPVDYDDMTITALDPGRSFHERSTMLVLSRWEHRRTVRPVPGPGGPGRREPDEWCEVTDELSLTSRWRWAEPVARGVVRRLFAHRHRRLRRWSRLLPG